MRAKIRRFLDNLTILFYFVLMIGLLTYVGHICIGALMYAQDPILYFAEASVLVLSISGIVDFYQRIINLFRNW